MTDNTPIDNTPTPDLSSNSLDILVALSPLGRETPCSPDELEIANTCIGVEMAKMSQHISNRDPDALKLQSDTFLVAAESLKADHEGIARWYVPLLALTCMRRAVEFAYVNASENGSLAWCYRSNVLRHHCPAKPSAT